MALRSIKNKKVTLNSSTKSISEQTNKKIQIKGFTKSRIFNNKKFTKIRSNVTYQKRKSEKNRFMKVLSINQLWNTKRLIPRKSNVVKETLLKFIGRGRTQIVNPAVDTNVFELQKYGISNLVTRKLQTQAALLYRFWLQSKPLIWFFRLNLKSKYTRELRLYKAALSRHRARKWKYQVSYNADRAKKAKNALLHIGNNYKNHYKIRISLFSRVQYIRKLSILLGIKEGKLKRSNKWWTFRKNKYKLLISLKKQLTLFLKFAHWRMHAYYGAFTSMSSGILSYTPGFKKSGSNIQNSFPLIMNLSFYNSFFRLTRFLNWTLKQNLMSTKNLRHTYLGIVMYSNFVNRAVPPSKSSVGSAALKELKLVPFNDIHKKNVDKQEDVIGYRSYYNSFTPPIATFKNYKKHWNQTPQIVLSNYLLGFSDLLSQVSIRRRGLRKHIKNVVLTISLVRNNFILTLSKARDSSPIKIFSAGTLCARTTAKKRGISTFFNLLKLVVNFLKEKHIYLLRSVTLALSRFAATVRLSAGIIKQILTIFNEEKIGINRFLLKIKKTHGLIPRLPKIRRK